MMLPGIVNEDVLLYRGPAGEQSGIIVVSKLIDHRKLYVHCAGPS
jgi:hypothetical protein